MKIIKATFLLCCLLFTLPTFACDICGNYMGITPYHNKNTISFLHRYRIFNGYRNYQQQSHFFPASAYRTLHGDPANDTIAEEHKLHSAKDFESYKIFELRFKYFVWKRIELNVFVPLISNRSKTNTTYTSHTGLGDVSVNAGYHLLLPKDTLTIKQKLIVGLGLKTPTGNFYAHDAYSNRLPFEMQPGTGSFDAFAYMSYVVVSEKLGASVNLSYKVNGSNIYKEQVANSTTDFASVFYKLKYKQVLFYPSVQCNYEYTKGLYIKHRLQKYTNVNSLLVGPGLDVYYKSFSVNASWQFTAYEDIAKGELKSAGRLSAGINYSFGKD